jgi:hypothetical protein
LGEVNIKEHGYYMWSKYQPSESFGDNPNNIVGNRSIIVHLGAYKNVFKTDVNAFFAFDENDILIDIAISKITDSL